MRCSFRTLVRLTRHASVCNEHQDRQGAVKADTLVEYGLRTVIRLRLRFVMVTVTAGSWVASVMLNYLNLWLGQSPGPLFIGSFDGNF
jgi:hypothetical protein